VPGESLLAPATNQPDDRLLVEAAKRDPARFAELYERNFDRVYAYVCRRLTDRGAAEDVTAEVFHQALANIDRFEWRGTPFVAWLLRIAANAVVDYWRRASREQQLSDEDAPESFPVDAGNIEQVERQAMIYRLVRTLPSDQRRVLEMRFAEDKRIREIAQELGRTEGSVKQLQFRAIQTLRAQLQVPGEDRTNEELGEANA
jgi:RNA polymerase sigma-70 factor, ECF subfamily